MKKNALGPLLAALLAALAGPSCAETLTRTAAFAYDPATGLLVKEIVEPDSAELCLVTEYAYDAYGNKLSATTRNCDGGAGEAPAPTGAAAFAARTSSTAYDARGQFPLASTNALGHTETRVFEARFGAVTSLTGPNGLVTAWTYDGFGRKTQEARADGTASTWTYERCADVGGCPAYGKVRVVATHTGAPAVTAYYDALNREIRTETAGFDGTLVRRDTEYDARGRVARASRPYYAGEAIAWTSYTYDELNRPLTETGPDGSVTTRTYAGLTTTATVSPQPGASQTRTTVKNSQGQVVAVTDAAGGVLAYQYDAFGNLVRTTDPAGNVSALAYDLRGRKTGMADPDMGAWSYAYNALGELVSQTDAKGQTVSMGYDALGRLVSRTEPDLVATWTYDSCARGVGKLCQVAADNGYQRTHGYDASGRPVTLVLSLDATSTMSTAYDAAGRVSQITYPTGFAVTYAYNARGYLAEIRKAADNALLWQATQMSASGQVLNETLGNGLLTTRSYDVMDRLSDIASGNGTSTVHHHSYLYDGFGNLRRRTDHSQSVGEEFEYDSLNRLVRLTMGSGPYLAMRSHRYDAIGNLTHKSDVGTYTYPAAGQPRPHAVTQVSGAMNASYSYDANGNLISGNGKTLSYTSFNAPSAIATANHSYTYTYGVEHERVRLVTVRPDDTLTSFYLHPAGKGALFYERETRQSDGAQEHKHYVMAGAEVVGVYVTRSTGSPEMRYYHADHLGSVAAITNESGAVIERLAYEAFGERRYPNGLPQDRASPLIGLTTDRGFTSHEHLDELNLIHMNGRIYDPALGRFMTPDPYVQAPGNLQSLNRYSYVLNNPLALIDPTGYFNLFKTVQKAWKKVWHSTAGRIVVIAAVSWYATGLVSDWLLSTSSPNLFAVHATSVLDGEMMLTATGHAVVGGSAGFAGGFVGSGGDFQTGLKAGLGGAVFGGINGHYGSTWNAERVVVSSVANGTLSQLNGGTFRGGALDAVRAALTVMGSNYATEVTNSLKQLSCATSPASLCRANAWGELLTDGSRIAECDGGACWGGNWLTKFGMAPEGSGLHMYDENGFLGRFINRVSKVHDLFNSWGYNWNTGAWVSKGEVYDSLFQVYSFAGMVPATVLTGYATVVSQNPVLLRIAR